MLKSKDNSDKYEWGQGCSGWHLLKSDQLGIIQELMPPGTEEKLHYHKEADQFFFVLSGVATFTVDGKTEVARQGTGCHIAKGKKHKIINDGIRNLEFILISQPHSHQDRFDIE